MHYFFYSTPHGPITVAANSEGVVAVAFGKHEMPGTYGPTQTTNQAATQIQEYFAGKRFAFDVPLCAKGTDFQKKVWARIGEIPYGSTNTAADIARAIGHAGAHRSVGAALAANRIAILVPDHRVVSAAGKAFGTGKAAAVRSGLLAFERRNMS